MSGGMPSVCLSYRTLSRRHCAGELRRNSHYSRPLLGQIHKQKKHNQIIALFKQKRVQNNTTLTALWSTYVRPKHLERRVMKAVYTTDSKKLIVCSSHLIDICPIIGPWIGHPDTKHPRHPRFVDIFIATSSSLHCAPWVAQPSPMPPYPRRQRPRR